MFSNNNNNNASSPRSSNGGNSGNATPRVDHVADDEDVTTAAVRFLWKTYSDITFSMVRGTMKDVGCTDMTSGNKMFLPEYRFAPEYPWIIVVPAVMRGDNALEAWNISDLLCVDDLMIFTLRMIEVNNGGNKSHLRRVLYMMSHADSILQEGRNFHVSSLAQNQRPNQFDGALLIALIQTWSEFGVDVEREVPDGRPRFPFIRTAARGPAEETVGDSTLVTAPEPASALAATPTGVSSGVHVAASAAVSTAAAAVTTDVSAPAATPSTPVSAGASAPAGPGPTGSDGGGGRHPDPGGAAGGVPPLPVEEEPEDRVLQKPHDIPHSFTDYSGGRVHVSRTMCWLFVLSVMFFFAMFVNIDAGCELIRPAECDQYRIAHLIFDMEPDCRPPDVRYGFLFFGGLRKMALEFDYWVADNIYIPLGLFKVAAWVKHFPQRDAYLQCTRGIAAFDFNGNPLRLGPRAMPYELVFVFNWIVRWSWVVHVIMVWYFATRRRITYTLLGIDRSAVAPDIRPTSHTVVKAKYSAGYYATVEVVEWDHNPVKLFKMMIDGVHRRREIVSVEVAVSCLDPRITSRPLRNDDDVKMILDIICAKAGIENRVNLDRYTAAFHDVPYATARWAYHYKMHMVRHQPPNFKCGANEDLYALGYRVTDVKTKKATNLRAGCVFRLRSRQVTGRMIVQVHLGCGDLNATMPAPDRAHGLSSFVGACVRLAPELPLPPEWFLAFCWEHFDEWVSGLFQPVPPLADFSFEKWLSTRPYTESRKDELRKARESYPYLSRGPPMAFTAESFIKQEPYEGVWDAFLGPMPDSDITDKVPRWICPTSDWSKAWIGPYISIIEHYVFSCPRLIKMVPGHLRTQFLYERLFTWVAEYLERDVTSAESHHGAEWIPFAMRFYRYMLQHNLHEEAEYVLSLIEATMRNPGDPTIVNKFFTILKLILLKSGRMDTSLINVFLFMFIYDMQNKYRFNIDFNHVRPSLVVFESLVVKFFDEHFPASELAAPLSLDAFEGDDSITTAFDGQVLTDAMYREVGVKLESRRSVELSGTDFCAMIMDVVERIMITNVVAAYVAFGWASDAYLGVKPIRKLELLRARAYSMLYQYNSCPILHELALYILRVTAHVDLSRFFRVRNKLSEWEMTQLRQAYDALRHQKVFVNRCGPRTRALVERLYNVTISMQLRAEEKLRSYKHLQRLDLLPDVVIPTHWLSYHQHFVKPYSRQQIKDKAYASAQIALPTYCPFDDQFFNRYGRQIKGRNGLVGEAAVRDYFGL